MSNYLSGFETDDREKWVKIRKFQIEKEKAMEPYRSLAAHNPDPKQNFLLLVYFLLPQPKNDLHGMWFFIGAFPNLEKAKSQGQEIAKKYGLNDVMCIPMCKWREIRGTLAHCTKLSGNEEELLEQKEQQEYEEKLVRLEKDVSLTRKMAQNRLKSTKVGTVEHYSSNWYQATDTWSNLQQLKQQCEQAQKDYDYLVKIIREEHNNHPHLEQEVDKYLLNSFDEQGLSEYGQGIINSKNIIKADILMTN